MGPTPATSSTAAARWKAGTFSSAVVVGLLAHRPPGDGGDAAGQHPHRLAAGVVVDGLDDPVDALHGLPPELPPGHGERPAGLYRVRGHTRPAGGAVSCASVHSRIG